MPNGFPAFRSSSLYPDEQPPTWFHPASPKVKPAKPSKEVKDMDNASLASTSTFSSTFGLLKNSLKPHLPSSYKEYRSRKNAAAQSTVSYPEKKDGESSKDVKEKKKLPDYDARARTAEAYYIFAMSK